MKLIYTIGLPASGKTTWAKEYVEKNIDWIRVSRDDLRNMRGKYWIPKQEKLITKLENICIVEALKDGKNVIVDATNLNSSLVDNRTKNLREEFPDLEIKKKVFNIDVKEAIKRDLKRTRSVGADVIQNMYDKYLAPEPVVYEEDNTLPKCVIFDVDGTLAKMNGRSPFAWDKVDQDLPNINIINLSKLYKNAGYKIIIFTGRDGSCLELTSKWLLENGVSFDDIYIRKTGDQRKDSIIKKELFENNIRGNFYVELVVDDRDQVVEMWRKDLGLTCLQVDYGNF